MARRRGGIIQRHRRMARDQALAGLTDEPAITPGCCSNFFY
jgi:hypothetical protein